MKLSNDTLNVLKNFASINQSIMFKKGKTLKTVSGGKNVLAEATINEEIPADFGVYNLNEFLSVLSLHKEDVTLDLTMRMFSSLVRKAVAKSNIVSVPPA
jgi:hypothetical protein